MKKFFLLLCAALLWSSAAFAEPAKNAKQAPPSPAPAATPPAAAAAPAPIAAEADQKVPDISNMLFIQSLRKAGTTIYYLGDALGLHGWFAVKDKQVQIFYTTPDNHALLVGALLSPEGANISQQQVMALANSRPEVKELLKGAEAEEAPSAGPAASEPSQDASAQFYAELLKGATLSFGKENAPQLVMIMDVRCHFCHATWTKLAPLVDQGKLRITMFPINALGPESQTEAANWLSQKDPYDAWKKSVAGDDKVLKAGLPDPSKELAIQNNTQLVQKWHVDQTPYLLYRGKNGKIRLIVGEPQSAQVIMNDIGG